MSAIKERFSVVIIGAGVAGLTLANILVRNEISCLVLERNSAMDIEKRQRAGTVEVRAVRMFERWGLGNVVMAGPPYDGITEFRLDGHRRVFREQLTQDILATPARLCPQQILVRNLIDSLSQTGTHIRFESSDVSLSQLQTSHPIVSYRDAEGMLHEVNCDYVAGCDGFHGISRKSIPDGVLTQHSREFGVAWLNVLADVPPRILMAMGNHGFAAQFPRGPLSRFYLQCSTEDTEEDWPDERIWAELRARLGEDDMLTGPITDRLVFPLRSAVFDPMRYGQLFLVGDAAHIISPVGGKGMNLALFDADTLAQALIDQLKNGDDAGLCQYSDTCLRRTWNYQEFSATLTDTLHASCDTTAEGGFQRHLARARFERMFNSDNAARSYSELIAGML